MKKTFIILTLLMFLTSMSYSQLSSQESGSKYSIGIFAGFNIPRLSGGSNNEMSRDYRSRSGEAFGLTAGMNIGSNFSLWADIMYSSEGGRRNGVQAIDASTINPMAPAGTYLYADFNNESILNYLEIPVRFKYSMPVFKSSNLYFDLGPYIGFLINARQKTNGSSIIYADRAETNIVVPVAQSFNADSDITSSINSINFGMIGGIGVAKRLHSGDLFVDLRASYGMKAIQKDPQNGTSYSGNLLLDIGYLIPF